MKIHSENQLLAIDETCLSELSEENEATISGGFFFFRAFRFFRSFWRPRYYSWGGNGGGSMGNGGGSGGDNGGGSGGDNGGGSEGGEE